ncbi:MAG: hypothetical protein ACYDDU_20220 [Dermatophilaceae bacterium]
MVLNSKNAAKRAARGLPEPPTCKAHNRDGSRCKKSPTRGATVCRMHGAGAPAVKEAARNRLAMAADGLMQTLLKIAASAESEAVRLSAVNSALDRAGFSAAHMVKLAVVAPWEELLAEIVDDDIFIDVPEGTQRRALPARSSGGFAEDEDDDEQEEYNRTAVAYADEDRPASATTIRGKVIYPNPTPEQQAAAHRTEHRARSAIFDTDEPDERSEYGERDSAPMTDSNRPPKYVRDAMEADGKDWRTGESGGSRRADMGS